MLFLSNDLISLLYSVVFKDKIVAKGIIQLFFSHTRIMYTSVFREIRSKAGPTNWGGTIVPQGE
jgi:hypothetical protein